MDDEYLRTSEAHKCAKFLVCFNDVTVIRGLILLKQPLMLTVTLSSDEECDHAQLCVQCPVVSAFRTNVCSCINTRQD